MSARDQIMDLASRISAGLAPEWCDEMRQHMDTYRAEGLAKAIGRLRAIPVTCTALTGPVWYGDGWNSAITQLEEIADYQTPDDEAYPGELERLRALALAVRVVVRNRRERSVEEQQAEVQRVMDAHLALEKDATKNTAPDFFQPEHSYTHRDGSTFRCVAVTTHPDGGERVAIGWHTDTAGWTFIDFRNINHWNHEYDGVQPPTGAGETPASQHYDKVPDPADGCHWCACGNRWPCQDATAVTA
ncbi:hypothetical protein ACFXKC_28450 [Streptomyces sp. NPDC059340]|uniref:hypothetical protein n=1 Tax=Streptomyces sp. NPDC059340 TaxID=3346806 RepID=UPI0036C94C2C